MALPSEPHGLLWSPLRHAEVSPHRRDRTTNHSLFRQQPGRYWPSVQLERDLEPLAGVAGTCLVRSRGSRGPDRLAEWLGRFTHSIVLYRLLWASYTSSVCLSAAVNCKCRVAGTGVRWALGGSMLYHRYNSIPECPSI